MDLVKLDDGVSTKKGTKDSEIEFQKLTYGQLVCLPRVVFAALTAGTMNMVYGTFEPTLSLRLEDYNLS